MIRAVVLSLLTTSVFGCAPPIAPPAPPAVPVVAPPKAELPGGEPLLRLPVARGSVVLCQQGNRSPIPQSHGYPNALHALDLSTPGIPSTTIVAAAPGVVARVVTGASKDAVEPGDGWGNHVTIRHANGYFTLYAHFASVSVHPGDIVRAGTPLGVMGETGKAGSVHVHFSLHHGDGSVGVPPSVPMHGLVTADVTAQEPFALHTSLDLVCADSSLSTRGHLYGSENDTHEPFFGPVPVELARNLDANAKTELAAIPRVNEVDGILADLTAKGPIETRSRLEEWSHRNPGDAVALYWILVISLRDLDDLPRAKTALAEIDQVQKPGAPWLPAWILVRRGEIAEREKRVDDARDAFVQAAAIKNQGADYERFVAEALKRVGPKPTHPFDSPHAR